MQQLSSFGGIIEKSVILMPIMWISAMTLTELIYTHYDTASCSTEYLDLDLMSMRNLSINDPSVCTFVWLFQGNEVLVMPERIAIHTFEDFLADAGLHSLNTRPDIRSFILNCLEQSALEL